MSGPPPSLGYTMKVRKTFRDTWKWSVFLGGHTAYGLAFAEGEADDPAQAFEQAAEAMRTA